MNKSRLAVSLLLLSGLALSACGKDSSSSSTPISSEPAPSETSSSGKEEETLVDPISTVLDGLDMSKDAFNFGAFYSVGAHKVTEGENAGKWVDSKGKVVESFKSNLKHGGYVTHELDSKGVSHLVAYGWSDYTIDVWNSEYGFAVKLVFGTDGKVSSVEFGLPNANAHNFTPSYAADAGKDAFAAYVKNFEKAYRTALVGKKAMDLFETFKAADVGQATENTKTFEAEQSFTISGSKTFVDTGATQTIARTENAIKLAALAFLLETNPNSQVMPFLASRLTSANFPGDKGGEGAFKLVDGAYGYAGYQQWGSVYGGSVHITTYPGTKKIKGVKLGTPIVGAHNFTPMYALNNPAGFLNFYQNAQNTMNQTLVGKTVTQELVDSFKSSIVLQAGEGNSTYTPAAGGRFVGTGATQTDTRLDMGVHAALEKILSDDAAVEVDPTSEADTVLPGLDVSKGTYRTNPNYSKNQDWNGYSEAETDGDIDAYGWKRYENPYAKGSYYGAAVKLVIDKTAGTIKDVVVGLPKDGDVNLTSLYQAYYSDEDVEAFENYFLYLPSNLKAALLGKKPEDVYYATMGAQADGTTFLTGSLDFLGAGATQTTSRINVALFEASSAYMHDHDPFLNDLGTNLPKMTVENNKVTRQGAVIDNGDNTHTAYGEVCYFIPEWSSAYGAALAVTYDADYKITKIATGKANYTVPGAKYVGYNGNFTPSYALNGAQEVYYYYYTSIVRNIEKQLVGKTINSDLTSLFKKSYDDLSIDASDTNPETRVHAVLQGEDKESQIGFITRSEYNAWTGKTTDYAVTGASETNTRTNNIIYVALEAALATKK